jgi:DNA-binding NarL/FixJ family response regulator
MPRTTTQRPERSGGIAVALVDGVPLFRDGLSALVQRTPGLRWVGAAERPTAALQLRERFRPDLMVIDSGLDPRAHLCHMLASAADVNLLVLVQEAHRNTQYLAAALAAGVHGLVLRSAEGSQITEAIYAVQDDGRYLDPKLAPVLAAPRGKLKHWVGTDSATAVPARAPGAAADRGRPGEPVDREDPVRVGGNRAHAREEHPAQAGGTGPHTRRGGRVPYRRAYRGSIH